MNTITVRYWGRLGNMLFQIGAAVAYSYMVNRKFILEKFPSFPNLEKYSPESIEIPDSEYVNMTKDYSEEEIGNNVPFPENQHVRLTGFFQNYLLFDKYKDYILYIIGHPKLQSDILPVIQGPVFQKKNLFQKTIPTVSLHIRRGDYEKIPCYFLLLNQYYYKLALLHILGRISEKINVLVFYERNSRESANKIVDILKNDTELERLEFHDFNDLLDEQQGGGVTDIEEMIIMSQCDHHIIANSTYSWWSAYINYNLHKIVCYPDQHYNHQLYYLSSKGLEVDGWTSISAWNPQEPKCGCYY
jgi:hypothetical protein